MDPECAVCVMTWPPASAEVSVPAAWQVMGPSCKIYALKRIRLAGRDAEAASGFIDEINLLQRLRNKPNIIQLIDSQVGGQCRAGASPGRWLPAR